MTNLWLPILMLLSMAAVFLLWPLWRFRKASLSPSNAYSEKAEDLVRLYREHLTDLQNQQANGRLATIEFLTLKLELERKLLADHAQIKKDVSTGKHKNLMFVSLTVILLLLLLSFFTYYKMGGLQDVYIKQLQTQKMQQDYQQMLLGKKSDPELARQLAEEYENRLAAQPKNLQYLFLLARTRMELGQHDKAVDAYKKVLEIDAQSPMIMAELAKAIFFRNGNLMDEEAVSFAQRALSMDAKNGLALELLGIDAYNKKDFKTAIHYWKRVLQFVDKDSEDAKVWHGAILKASEEYKAAGGDVQDLMTNSPYTLTLKVSLNSEVKVPQDAMVFVYARGWQASPMPLAVQRIRVSDLPQTIQLDETMAMSPVASLATATQVEVVARISQDGSANTKSGDWEVKAGPIDMKSIPESIELEIKEQVK